MTAAHMIDPARVLGQALSHASPDLMRLGAVINALLSADADAVNGQVVVPAGGQIEVPTPRG